MTDSVHRTGETVGRESRFRLSARITLKDVGRQHGRIRGFAEEPAVIQVPLDLQEDEVPVKRRVAESGVWWWTQKPMAQLRVGEKRGGIEVREELERHLL